MKKLSFFIVFCIFFTINLRAQYGTTDPILDEYFIGSSSNGIDFYVKISTIKKEYGNIYRAWIYSYPNNEALPKERQKYYKVLKNAKYLKYKMDKKLYYIKCGEDEIRLAKTVIYDIHDEIIDNDDFSMYETPYEKYIPDSMGESIYEYICKYVQENKIK